MEVGGIIKCRYFDRIVSGKVDYSLLASLSSVMYEMRSLADRQGLEKTEVVGVNDREMHD